MRCHMFDRQPVLASERLILRPLRAEDFDGLFAVSADPELWAQHPAHDRWQEPVFRDWFKAALESGGTMVAVDRASGAIIGTSRYNIADPAADRAEIGWSFLARSYWGGAWNREIKGALLAHAFKFVSTVYFRVGENNMRSRKAMEKLGARLSGETEVMTMPGGAQVTHVFYEITRAAFQAGW